MIIALGSNLSGQYDSCEALLEAALEAMNGAGFRVVCGSRWWRSASWPDVSKPAYINGVAIVETPFSPEQAIDALHGVEAAFGRSRAELNAPRRLDLDLVAFGRRSGLNPATPHPRAHERLFVMGPLAEIAPEWRHPILGLTALELAGGAKVGADAAPI